MTTLGALVIFLAENWLLAAVSMAALWTWQLRLQRRGLAEAAWPLVVAATAVLDVTIGDGDSTRRSAIGWMVGSWGARLGVQQVWDQVLSRPPDPDAGESPWYYQRRALDAVFFSLPALFASRGTDPELSSLELAASALWLVSFAAETTADRELARWRRAMHGGECRSGVWKYVPRAHDVFELTTWIAHALFAAASPNGWIAFVCPAAIACQMFTAAGTHRAQHQPLWNWIPISHRPTTSARENDARSD
jgi:steroid 5-alpha reductase family enzyme